MYLATTLKAAKSIALEQRSFKDPIQEGFVRLKLETASLCGTDLHYYKNFSNAGFDLQTPVTLGHEACARVLDPNGSSLNSGALVALNPIIFCKNCDSCKRGEINLCTQKRFPGSATTVPHIDGFFQEEFDFPAFCCHEVQSGIDPDHLTFAEPLACSMHSVTLSQAGSGKRILITGCGPMGLLAVVAAHATGAQVDVLDVREEAVSLAKEVGACEGFTVSDPALEEKKGFYDAVIEASGAPAAFNQGLDLVKRQGRLVILSNIQPSGHPIDLHKIMLKEISVLGSFQFNKEFDQALELISSGRVDFGKLIATRFPLSKMGEACDYMLAGKAAGKILLKPQVSQAGDPS